MATAPATELVVASNPQVEAYKIMKDQAKTFALSALLPDSIKGNSYEQAVANCLIATQMAHVMGEIPFVVMQNIHIVKGKAGFAAQYMIARANSSGLFKGRINWRVDKSDPNNLSVTAYAVLAETEEEVSFTVDMKMAQAEGWTSNTKYKTMPEVMLRYRSATFLIRFYAPDVMLGYRTTDEIEDIAYGNGASDDTPALPEPLRAEHLIEQAQAQSGERADETTGEVIEEADAEPVAVDADEPEAADDAPPYAAFVAEIEAGIRAAKNAKYLKGVEDKFLLQAAALPDDVSAAIEAKITAKRRALVGEVEPAE